MHSVVDLLMAGDVVGRQVTSGSLLTAFSSVVSSSFSGFTATWAFVATYIDVPAYGIPSVRWLAWCSGSIHWCKGAFLSTTRVEGCMISAETAVIYATFMKVDSTCGILERNSLCFKNFMCVYMYASCACTCTCTCTHQVHVHDVSCAYASICSLYSMYITCHVWTLGSGSCDICCLKCFLLIHYEYI